MNINKYLEQIQSDESIFPIDSYPQHRVPDYPERNRRKKKIRTTEADRLIKRRAMIDLDGTIHKYSKGYSDGSLYDDPFEGAREAIEWIRKQGYEIVIFTTRASKAHSKEYGDDHKKQMKNIKEWLKKHNIYFDKITGEKLAANVYIDDRAIHIPNGDWDYVIDQISKRISIGTI